MAKTVNIKKVNVIPSNGGAIFTPNRKIVKPIYGETLSTREIINCLSCRARVEEVLNDGTLLQLTITNYNTDNNVGRAKVVADKNIVNKIIKEPEVKKVEPKAPVIDPVRDELEAKPVQFEPIVQPDMPEPIKEEVEVKEEATTEAKPNFSNTKARNNKFKNTTNK